MIKDQNAQVSTELILIMAAMLIIVLTTAYYINNTLENITVHTRNVTSTIRDDVLTRL